MKNCNFHSPLVHVVLGVVQPHPDLDGVALPDEVEDVLHDAPGAGAPGDQVSSDVFSDVMSCAALPRCAQHAAHSALAQTGQPWILSTFCSQSRHFSGRRRRISVLFVTCIKSKASLKRVNVDRSLWQSPQTRECQIGGVFVNIYPGRCHNPLSSHCSAIEPQLDWTLNTQSRADWCVGWLTDWRQRPQAASSCITRVGERCEVLLVARCARIRCHSHPGGVALMLESTGESSCAMRHLVVKMRIQKSIQCQTRRWCADHINIT